LFDFPILRRMASAVAGDVELSTYDTLPLARELVPTSRKLSDLARTFEIPMGQAHRALDDTRALAGVFIALGEAKVVRARKTALVSVLDHLGVALALDQRTANAEVELFRGFTRAYALGKYGDALNAYAVEREKADDPS